MGALPADHLTNQQPTTTNTIARPRKSRALLLGPALGWLLLLTSRCPLIPNRRGPVRGGRQP